MRYRNGMGAILALVASLLVAGCGADKKAAGGGGLFGDLVDKETVRISAEEGGEVRVDSGGAATFPGQALSADTDVTNAEYTPGSEVAEEAVSNVFNVTPETPVGLDGSYRITLPYDPDRIGERLVVLRHRPFDTTAAAAEGGADVPIVDVTPFREDRENRVVTADVTSFGAYWVAAVDRSQAPDAEPDAGRPALDLGAPDAFVAPDAAAAPANPLLGPAGESTTTAITAAQGGQVVLASGMTATFLPGSLAADADITLAQFGPGEPLAGLAVSDVLVVTPESAAELLDIVSLALPYDSEAAAGRTLVLRARTYPTTAAALNTVEGESLPVADATDDPAAHTMYGSVLSFGAYWVEAK